MQLNSNSSSWYPPPGLPSLNKPLIPLTIIDDINEVEFEAEEILHNKEEAIVHEFLLKDKTNAFKVVHK